MKRGLDRLSINTVSIGAGSFRDKVKLLADNKIQHISIWYDDVKNEDIGSVKELFANNGLTPASMTFLGPFNQESIKEEEAARAEDLRKIEIASALGIDTLLALTGAQNGLSDKDAIELLKRSLKLLSKHCEKRCIKIALEPIHYMYQDEWTYISTFEEAFNIVTEIGSENVGLMLDVYHVWMEPMIIPKIDNSNGKIFGVQLSDWRPINRSKTDRVLPGEGCIPLNTLINSAEKAGWSSWYDIEIFSDELWSIAGQTFVERCVDAYKKL